MTSTAFFTTTISSSADRLTAFALLTGSLLCCCHAAAQAVDQTSRLEALRTATSLRHEGIKPWRLRLSFVLNDMNGKQQDSGTIDVSWQRLRRQKTTVESGLIHGTLEDALGSSDAKTAREAVLVGDLLEETVDPVAPLPKTGFEVREEKRSFGKATLTCLTVGKSNPSPIANSAFPTYCLEPDHPDVLRVRISGPQGSARNGTATFQNTHITINNAIDYSGVTAISGKIESLASIAPEPDDSEPDVAPAPPQKVMGGVLAGHKISGVSPIYPQIARAQHAQGTVLLQGLIDKSGHIKRLVPIASPNDQLTTAAVDAVKTWTYEPYRLNGDPVEVDTTITVNFSLNGFR